MSRFSSLRWELALEDVARLLPDHPREVIGALAELVRQPTGVVMMSDSFVDSEDDSA